MSSEIRFFSEKKCFHKIKGEKITKDNQKSIIVNKTYINFGHLRILFTKLNRTKKS